MIAPKAAAWLGSRRPVEIRLGLALWCAIATAFMLFPFRFDYQGPERVPNGVSTTESGGLEFAGPSVWRTTAAPTWVAEGTAAGELDIVLELRTASTNQRGPARILTLSDGRLRRNFMVSQKGPDLLVRARRPGADENGAPPLKVDGVFAEPGDLKIEVRFRPLVIEILVNGQPRYRETLEASSLDLWDQSFALAIGDEVNGARGWNGEVRSATATVQGVTADILTTPGVERPDEFWNVPEQTRHLWRFDTSHFVIVETAHVLLFLPFGALLWLRRRRSSLGALVRIACAALFIAFIFQCTKVAFPGRHPSLYHLPFNLTGALLGAAWTRRGGAGRPSEPT